MALIRGDVAGDPQVTRTSARTTLGAVQIGMSAKGVCWLSFDETAERLLRQFPAVRPAEAGEAAAALAERVVAAIEAPSPAMHDIPLDLRGTPFQLRVWEALRRIPLGETRSYGELAAMLATTGASRAVGAANAANRIAVLVPCHRVVAANGSLGGYAWGLALKAELLRRESAAAPPLAGRLL